MYVICPAFGGEMRQLCLTCVPQRGFPRKHHGAPLLLHLDRVARAVRFELGLQLRQAVLRGSETS